MLVPLLRWLLKLFGYKPNPAFDEAVERLCQSPESSRPIDRQELFRELRKAMARTPHDKSELAELEAELYILGERIRISPVCNETPEIVWHFISDADIRFEDAEYRWTQCGAVEDCINHWEPAK